MRGRGSVAHYGIWYCSASVSVVLSGVANPGSRPKNWQHTLVPDWLKAGSGVPPNSPWAKEPMPID